MSKKLKHYTASFFMKPTGSSRPVSSSEDSKKRGSSDRKGRRDSDKSRPNQAESVESKPSTSKCNTTSQDRAVSKNRKSEPKKLTASASVSSIADNPAVSHQLPSAFSVQPVSSVLVSPSSTSIPCPSAIPSTESQRNRAARVKSKLDSLFGPDSPSSSVQDSSIRDENDMQVGESQSEFRVDVVPPTAVDQGPMEVEDSRSVQDTTSKLIEALDALMPTFLYENSFVPFSDRDSLDTTMLDDAMNQYEDNDHQVDQVSGNGPGGMTVVDDVDCTEEEPEPELMEYRTSGGVTKSRSVPPSDSKEIMSKPAELQVLGLMSLKRTLDEEKKKNVDQMRSLIGLNQFLPELGNSKMMKSLNFLNRADEDLAIRPTKSLVPRKLISLFLPSRSLLFF